MRASEMTPEQLEHREFIVQTLSAAGWTSRKSNGLFEQGWWLPEEAVLDYENAQAELIVMYNAEGHNLELLIDQRGWRYDFVIAFGERLVEVLETLIVVQDRLAFETVGREVATLLDLCPDGLVLYSEAEGRIPVDRALLASLGGKNDA
jgi:hypothetical protein